MTQYQFEVPTSHRGGFKVSVPENVLNSEDFWFSIDDTLDINLYRIHTDPDGQWRYVLYPVEDGQTNTNIVIDRGFTNPPTQIIMSEEKKKPLEQAVEIVSAALEKIKGLDDVEQPVNKEKFSEAIREAYIAGMTDVAHQINNASVRISLEEGGFEYNADHYICDLISVEDEIGCFTDDADTWINSSVAQRIENEFYKDDVS